MLHNTQLAERHTYVSLGDWCVFTSNSYSDTLIPKRSFLAKWQMEVLDGTILVG